MLRCASGRLQRILDPIALMGAQALSVAEGGRLPITVAGARDPIPILYRTPVPSAQISPRCCSQASAPRARPS